MSKKEIKKFSSVDELNKFAADEFLQLSNEAIADRGQFTVVLSGGSTPKKLFELLASDTYRNLIDWKNIHFFWGDERCVPNDSEESNYRMTNDALLSKIAIPKENIHRFKTELSDPKEIAIAMENEILEFFSDAPKEGTSDWSASVPLAMSAQREQTEYNNFPRFDLIFLGMGADGHTASLFPETAVLKESTKLVVENYVPKFDSYRLTFTYPIINNAREIIFLIAGKDKTETLKEVLEGKFEPDRLPSQAIKPIDGNLTFLIAP